jgi:archaellin
MNLAWTPTLPFFVIEITPQTGAPLTVQRAVPSAPRQALNLS